MGMAIEKAFIEFSCEKLEQLTERICVCLDQLNAEQIWFRGAQNENAIGNLVLHLCGNVRQWIGFGIGGLPDSRERSLEFSARGGVGANELKSRLQAAVTDAIAIIGGLTRERLEQETRIQNYDVTVLQAVLHVVEHFAGHAGQIIFSTKHFTGKGLGFYRHLDSPQSPPQSTP